MKKMFRTFVLSLCFALGCMAYGAVPPLSVTVSDASGKAAFRGTTDKSGGFTTPKLNPGNYVVQFNSPSGAVTGSYSIVVSAGVKKVSASGVAGEKFAKGGVALKVNVGNLLNVVGQVAAENSAAMKDGKEMVWIPPQLGSNRPGHWVEKDSAEAKLAGSAGNLSTDGVRSLQDRH